MKYYALSRIKHDGKVYTKGDTIELEKNSQLVKAGVVALEKPVEPVVAENRDLVIDDKTRAANKKTKGKKTNTTDTTTDKDEDGVEGGKYDNMSANELKAELDKRGLKGGRSNASRIAALEEDDAKEDTDKDEDGVGDDL